MTNYDPQIIEKCKKIWLEELEKLPLCFQTFLFNSDYIMETDYPVKVKTFFEDNKIAQITYRLNNDHAGIALSCINSYKILKSFTRNLFEGLGIGLGSIDKILYFFQHINNQRYGPFIILTPFLLEGEILSKAVIMKVQKLEMRIDKYFLFDQIVNEKQFRNYLSEQKRITVMYMENILL